MAEIVALVVKVPSNTVYKKATESLNVDVEYEYRGPAQRVYFTAVVTQETFYQEFDEIGSTKKVVYVDLPRSDTLRQYTTRYQEFDEIGSTKKVVYVDLPRSDTLRQYTTRIPRLPLSGVEPKTSAYGVKVKVEGTFGTVEAGDKSCLYVTTVAPEVGSFTVYAENMPPVYPIVYWCVEWEANGEFYYSDWAQPATPVTVPSTGTAPLTGKMAALLWTGEGDPIKYGPTTKYTLKDGGVYAYYISDNVLYTR